MSQIKFGCGHWALTGVGERCMECHSAIDTKPKMGRPVTKTKEERRATQDAWQKKNRVKRNKYHLERSRRVNGVVKGQFVIEFEGKFKRDRNTSSKERWGTFDQAHTYQSLGKASNAVKMLGKGVTMAKKTTERATRSNYKANGLNELQEAK